MTEEQQKFIAEQYENGIIRGFFKHHPNLSEDEYYDLACIGLCKCVPNYDKSKGEFTTYAYRSMMNEIGKYLQGQNVQKRKVDKPNLSLNYKLGDEDGDRESEEQLVVNSTRFENDVEYSVCYQNAMDKLNDRQKQIVEMRLQGYTQREIGEQLGISQQGVNFLNKKIKEIISQEYAL